MLSSWWILWMVFMLLFLVPTVSYGWGYRRWGPPYPRYIQRRRGIQAMVLNGPAAFDHHAWGRGGDFVWVVLLVGVFWAAMAFFWGR